MLPMILCFVVQDLLQSLCCETKKLLYGKEKTTSEKVYVNKMRRTPNKSNCSEWNTKARVCESINPNPNCSEYVIFAILAGQLTKTIGGIKQPRTRLCKPNHFLSEKNFPNTLRRKENSLNQPKMTLSERPDKCRHPTPQPRLDACYACVSHGKPRFLTPNHSTKVDTLPTHHNQAFPVNPGVQIF